MDFNNEATMGKKPTELVSSIIIEKVYNFLEADEDWAKKSLQGGQVTYSIARARLRTMFFSCHTLLKRNMSEKDYDWLTSICLSTDQNDVKSEESLEAFGQMFIVLDKIGLWKIDTRAVYNRERVEEANKAHGN
jgi:hypothetical protein